MNKKQLQARYNYYKNILKQSTYKHFDVINFYDKPSHKKIRAEYFIKEKMSKCGGSGYRIIGGNCHQFTCGWTYKKDNKNYFVFETRCNAYELEITE